jgi:hypothetical protein
MSMGSRPGDKKPKQGAMNPLGKSKREKRADRHITGRKGTPHGRCIRHQFYAITLQDGRVVRRVRYLHVTKGWRDMRV